MRLESGSDSHLPSPSLVGLPLLTSYPGEPALPWAFLIRMFASCFCIENFCNYYFFLPTSKCWRSNLGIPCMPGKCSSTVCFVSFGDLRRRNWRGICRAPTSVKEGGRQEKLYGGLLYFVLKMKEPFVYDCWHESVPALKAEAGGSLRSRPAWPTF